MTKNKTFTPEFTAKMAKLSALNLDKNEIRYFSKQFSNTLEVIENIKKIADKDSEEAFNISGLMNVKRDDLIQKDRILSQEDALSNGKRKYKGFFVVKGILDEQ